MMLRAFLHVPLDLALKVAVLVHIAFVAPARLRNIVVVIAHY